MSNSALYSQVCKDGRHDGSLQVKPKCLKGENYEFCQDGLSTRLEICLTADLPSNHCWASSSLSWVCRLLASSSALGGGGGGGLGEKRRLSPSQEHGDHRADGQQRNRRWSGAARAHGWENTTTINVHSLFTVMFFYIVFLILFCI